MHAMKDDYHSQEGEPEPVRKKQAGNSEILVVITGNDADYQSFDYALNMALRTEANLEVLTNDTEERDRERLDSFRREAEKHSVGFKVVRKKGCIRKAIVRHTREKSNLLCVVIESADSLNIDCSKSDSRLRGVWEELGCPLALVSRKTETETI